MTDAGDAVPKFERFLRLAAGLDLDKDDLKRYGDSLVGSDEHVALGSPCRPTAGASRTKTVASHPRYDSDATSDFQARRLDPALGSHAESGEVKSAPAVEDVSLVGAVS